MNSTVSSHRQVKPLEAAYTDEINMPTDATGEKPNAGKEIRRSKWLVAEIGDLLSWHLYQPLERAQWLREGVLVYAEARQHLSSMVRVLSHVPQKSNWKRASQLQDALVHLERCWAETCGEFVEELRDTPCGNRKDLHNRLAYLEKIAGKPAGIKDSELPSLLANIEERLVFWETIPTEEIFRPGRIRKPDTSRTPKIPTFVSDPSSRRFRN
ncbi:hypothetical protein [Deinococcus yunweiensis]|uniref:hypothetical protein n=1 Tax=Deinococcus yunweiensis TaxID=367282 RepID=UPI00398E87EE